jgi:hypothetical protein
MQNRRQANQSLPEPLLLLFSRRIVSHNLRSNCYPVETELINEPIDGILFAASVCAFVYACERCIFPAEVIMHHILTCIRSQLLPHALSVRSGFPHSSSSKVYSLLLLLLMLSTSTMHRYFRQASARLRSGADPGTDLPPAGLPPRAC